MEQKGKPTFITYIQAIYNKCEDVAWAIEKVEVMRRAEKEKGVEIRLKELDKSIMEMKDFFSDDIEKIFRRTMLEMDADKQAAYRNEIKTSLDELRFKLSDILYSRPLELYNSVYLKVITALESDIDFIKGSILLSFTPQGTAGYFEVSKYEIKRRYTLEKYFDLELRNWEFAIDQVSSKTEKLQIANNGIFDIRKSFLNYTHPKVQELKEKIITHLMHILEYLNSDNNVSLSIDIAMDDGLNYHNEKTEIDLAFIDFPKRIIDILYVKNWNKDRDENFSKLKTEVKAKSLFLFKKYQKEPLIIDEIIKNNITLGKVIDDCVKDANSAAFPITGSISKSRLESDFEDYTRFVFDLMQRNEKRKGDSMDKNGNEQSQISKLKFPESKIEQQSFDSPQIQNNFDSVKIIDVYNHFNGGLVKKKYLTDEELYEYLKAAFEKKTPPQMRFKIKDAPTKNKIMQVFYTYYKNIAGKPHGKQPKYAALLGEYFEGYNTETVRSNFNKA